MKRKFLSILVALTVLATCVVAVPVSADAYTPKVDLSFEGLTLPEVTTYYVDEDFNSKDDAYSITSVTPASETDGNKHAKMDAWATIRLLPTEAIDCDKLVVSVDVKTAENAYKTDFVLQTGADKNIIYQQSFIASLGVNDIGDGRCNLYQADNKQDANKRVNTKAGKNAWNRYTYVFERRDVDGVNTPFLTQVRALDTVHRCDYSIPNFAWWDASISGLKIKVNVSQGNLFDNIVVYGYKADGSVTEPEQPGPEQPDEPEQPSGTITLNQYMPKPAKDLIKWDFNTTQTIGEYTQNNINAHESVIIKDNALYIPSAWKTVKFRNIKMIESDRLAIHFKVSLGNYMQLTVPGGGRTLAMLQCNSNTSMSFYRYEDGSREDGFSGPQLGGSGKDYMHTFDIVLKRVGDSAQIEAVYIDDIPIEANLREKFIGKPFEMKWWVNNNDGVFCFTQISGAENYIDDLYVYIPEDINVSSDVTNTSTTVTLQNTSNASATGVVIVAYYDESGKLIQCAKNATPVTVAGYTYASDFASQSIDFPVKPAGAKTMKVFYWNNLDDVVPLSDDYAVVIE